MNVVAAISKLFAEPISEVAAIVAGVPKAPELIEAERAFLETVAARPPLSKRRAEIHGRLNFRSPLSTLFEPEQKQLETEQADIDRQVAGLDRKAAELRRQIDSLKPAYAQAVAGALASFRHRAAENLLDSITALEEAITDITETAKALSSIGVSVSSASPLPCAKAFRNLADKILTEKLNG